MWLARANARPTTPRPLGQRRPSRALEMMSSWSAACALQVAQLYSRGPLRYCLNRRPIAAARACTRVRACVCVPLPLALPVAAGLLNARSSWRPAPPSTPCHTLSSSPAPDGSTRSPQHRTSTSCNRTRTRALAVPASCLLLLLLLLTAAAAPVCVCVPACVCGVGTTNVRAPAVASVARRWRVG